MSSPTARTLAKLPSTCRDVRFTVEMETKASNARGHSFAHAKAIKLERDTIALAFLRFLPRGIPGFLEPLVIERVPRGTTRKAKALATKLRKSLKVPDRILQPMCPLVVELTRISFGKLDDDNLRAALKGVRDEIAWQLGVNDRDPIVRWDYEHPGQEHGPKGYAAVRVRIRARDLPQQAFSEGTVVQEEQPREALT